MIYVIYRNTRKGRRYLKGLDTYCDSRELAANFEYLEDAQFAARMYKCEVEILEIESMREI